MSGLGAATREQIAKRKAEAHAASEAFDFVRDGALATFYRQATPGTTYWRGVIPMLYLPGQVVPLCDEAIEAQQGAAIWQFLGDQGRSNIALQMQRDGIYTVLEVDDNYLRYAPTLYGKNAAWAKTHKEAVANGTGYSVEMHRKVVPLMDSVICSTDALAEEYAEYHPNVHVCRNSIIPEDWAPVVHEESDVLRIGYYGSVSHLRDYPKVKKALKWAQRQPGVEVVMIGMHPPGFTGKVYPWQDHLFGGRMNLGKIDVGIAPVTRNAWADGKSDIKAMEYAMAGVLPLLEDAPPYYWWTRDLGWPWKADSPESWDALIKTVVSEREHVKAEAAKAKEYVLAHRTIDQEIHKWREAIADGAS